MAALPKTTGVRPVALAAGVAALLLVLLGLRTGSGRAAAPEPGAPVVAPTPEPEPAAGLPSPVELTEEDVEQLHVDVEFGTLEILVVDGRSPALEAEVLVHGRHLGGPPEDERVLAEHGFSQITDARGLARFYGVPGDTYDIRVLHAPFPVQQVTMTHAPNRNKRVLVCFGGSALRGFVWDEQGQPLADCVVTAETTWAPYTGQTLRAWTRTGPDGSYLLDGLISNGAYSVHRSCGVANERALRIGLEAGEEKVVDFGAASGLARWSGTILDRHDAPVPGPGWIELERRENAALTGFHYDEEGRFTAGLEPGTYSARIWTWNGVESLAVVKMAHDDVEFDLNVPGTRVVAHISYYGEWPRPEEVTDRVGMSLSAPGKPHVLPNIRAGSTRAFLGVPPGDYTLNCWPNPISGAPEGGLLVHVDGEHASLEVEVTVGDP